MRSKRTKPPKLAERILRSALPHANQKDVLGDLNEIFQSRAERQGPGSARRWYWVQAVTLPLWFLKDSAGTLTAQVEGEVRQSTRALLREPGFTFLSVLVLGLAIGVNTAIYSVADGVLFESLPYPHPDRLVSVGHTRTETDIRWLPSATGLQEAYSEAVPSFESIALYRRGWGNLSTSGRADRILMATVTPSLFQVLGTAPVLGRPFASDEGRPWSRPVAILSHLAWEELFDQDPDVLGRTLRLDGVRREIVGVMAEGFSFPEGGVRVWVPLPIDPSSSDFGGFNYPSIARLSEGATPEAAAGEIQAVLPTLSERFPYLSPEYLEASQLRADVHPYLDDVVGNVRTALLVVMGVMGLVLLIACANVANLFLARAEGRQGEVAIRVALGAGRTQLALRFLVESAVLVAAGGVVGVLLAQYGLTFLSSLGSQDLPRIDNIEIDGSVLAAVAGIMAAATLGFGLMSRLRLTGTDPAPILRDGRGGSGNTARGRWARFTLVASQVALALVLLSASALMLESFRALRSVDPGFRSEGVLTFRVTLPEADYPSWGEAAQFHREFLDRLQAMAGVEAVGAVTNLPLSGRSGLNPITVQGRTYDPESIPPIIQSRAVTPGYFQALNIPLVAGRMVERADEAGRTGAVLLSQNVVDAVFPQDDPVGARVIHGLPGSREGWSEVVGIVGDVHDASLTQDPMGVLYFTLRPGDRVQKGWLAQDMSYALRSDLPPLSLLPAIRGILKEMDPTLPLADPQLLEDLVQRASAEMGFILFLVGTAGGLGVLLATVGLFGVVSYLTALRTREMGIRVALGARKGAVRSLVLRQGLVVTGVGLGAGLATSLVFSRFLDTLLFGVESGDPATLLVVTVLLAAINLAATWVPASRATRVDPAEALRSG